MKTTIRIGALLVAVTLFTGACKKKEAEPAEDPAPAPAPAPQVNGSMSAKLNGVSWTSTKNTASYVLDEDNDMAALVLNGETTADIIAIGIDFPNHNVNMPSGNHDFNGNLNDALLTYTRRTSGGGTVTEHFPKSGNINITSVDNANKKVSGTFDFVLAKAGAQTKADSLFITNGVFTNISFNVVYQ